MLILICIFGFVFEALSKPLLTKENNIWRHKDKGGLLYPYCTKPFLDFLDSQNMKKWEIFEWGSGGSTVWFASKCKRITSIEHDKNWLTDVTTHLKILRLKNGILKLRNIEQPKNKEHPILGTIQTDIFLEDGLNSNYVKAIKEDNRKYDCIFIDGLHRHACAKIAINHIKPGGIIVLNNVNQKTLGIDSTPVLELYKNYKHHSFKQPNHLDWRTDYWIIK